MTEVIARRQFSPGYIWFDIAFCRGGSAARCWPESSSPVKIPL